MDITKFNGRFTLQSHKTGDHRTFKVKTIINKDDDGNETGTLRMVGMLTGCDNTRDYTYFAVVGDRGVFPFRKHRGTQWESYANLIHKMFNGRNIPADVLHAEVKCRRCSRDLTTPESLALGLGPECAKK